jgi:phospholipid transport system substrate-binding protein
MRRLAFLFVCLFSTFAVAAGATLQAADTPSATAVVEKLDAALLASMKGGAKMGFAGRRALLDPVVREAYDLPAMARVATGAAWLKMSDAEKKQVADTFADWTIATYASQFKSYDGEKFVIKSETDAARGRKAVEADIVDKNGGDPTALVYQLRDDGTGRWTIVDVYLDGSISQLALRRNEFAAVLGKSDVAGLVAQMKSQTEQLAKDG